MHGSYISGALSSAYRDYLLSVVANGKRGNADLCCYFLLRSADLLASEGNLGLITTNTISQGDTREVGLDVLIEQGYSLVRAIASRKWPGPANVYISEVWLHNGDWQGEAVLDGKVMQRGISTVLAPAGSTRSTPYPLTENRGLSFNGSKVYGQGFLLSPEDAQAMISKDPRNRDVLFPYLIGEEVNSRPDQSPTRWVINFFDWPMERASRYSECFEIVKLLVKLEREHNNRKARRDRWWQYGERAPGLYSAISGMSRVLVVAGTSGTLAFTFVPAGMVFSHALYVLSFDDYGTFALLQSSFHDSWARTYSSSMKEDLRYAPSDVFVNFPFPRDVSSLESQGGAYYDHRSRLMLIQQMGLTEVSSHLHSAADLDPDVARLRELQMKMDCAVTAAYGWTDLDLGHGFYETKQGVRFTISEAARREVLDRLLLLNHERYEEEKRQGLHDKPGKKASKSGGRGRNKVASGQAALTGLGE